MTGAWSFTCEYSSTDALLLRLNEVSGWKWSQGDSHWYGDYLATQPFPGVRLRICDFPGKSETGYVFDADHRKSKECTFTSEEIDAAFRKALALVPAHDVHEIEWFD